MHEREIPVQVAESIKELEALLARVRPHIATDQAVADTRTEDERVSNPGNWPVPSNPGVPRNPDLDGPHLCLLFGSIRGIHWSAAPPGRVGSWSGLDRSLLWGHPLDLLRLGAVYLGPARTEADLAAAYLRGRIEGNSAAIADIVTERLRQIEVEGWTPQLDDDHREGTLALAAACYALPDAELRSRHSSGVALSVALWPWDREWFKRRDRRRDLVKAAALLVAEIERMDRAAARVPRPEKPEG